jgi:ribose transport system permease protein
MTIDGTERAEAPVEDANLIHEPVSPLTSRISERVARFALVGVAVGTFLLFTILLPGVYATKPNIMAMLSSQSITLILTLAVLVPLRSGDFDLSVAANMVFCSALLGIMTRNGAVPLALAIVITLSVGLAIGLFNGFLIVVIGVNAFIVTLGAMTVLGGLAFGITGGSVLVNLPPALLQLGRTEILGLPLAIWYGWVLAVLLWYVFELTPLGRYLLFVGGNAESAELAGVPVRLTRMSAFAGSALLSAVAGVVLAAKFGSVDPTVAASFLLPPYAAAFLGTTVIQLGRFNVLGSIVGSYLLTIGITGLLLKGADPWVSDVFNGAALMAAVTFAKLVSRKRVR